MRTKTTARKKTAFQRLVSKKASYCKGRTTMAEVKKVSTSYISDAVKKGKTKAEAEKIARRVLSAGCKMTSSIAGKSKKRKTTVRRKVSKKK